MRTLLLLALLTHAAHATVVTTITDEDDGSLSGSISLREAVKYSASGNAITFAAALSGQTIRLTGGRLVIDKSLTLDASALPAGLILSADRTANGKTSDDTYAILLTGGNLLLDSLTLTGANCGERSGCITVQPSASFTVTLDHCTLTQNAGYHAAALYCIGSPARPTDAITIRNSTIFANSVVKGAVIAVASSNLTIQNSTFSHHEAGAISYGTNSTLVTLSILNSTISNSSENERAGIDIAYTSSPITVYINNTICAGNQLSNIYNPSPNATVSGSNNILFGNPLLAPLGNYGGTTQTMPPLEGSPAIDTGGATTLTTDQRGFPRDAAPDIGAAEYQGTPDLLRYWNRDFDGDGTPYGVEQALGTDSLLADAENPRNLKGPTFDQLGQVRLEIGFNPKATPATRWILKRSPDLSPGSFAEIYRYDRVTDTAAPGITFLRQSHWITVTDTAPHPGGAFYRFEALLEP